MAARPFTALHAREVGINSWQLRQLISGGQVRRLLREVYASSELPDTIDLRASALAMIAPEHAVICDRSAAWLWGVDVLRHWELEIVPRLDVYVLRGRTRLRRPQTGGGERDLRPEDIVTVGDIRATTPVRTSLDLGCSLGRSEALAAMDAFARTHGVGTAELMSLLPRYRRRRGVVQARELVPLVDSEVESTGESFVKVAIHDEGLPPPQPQFWVLVGGVPTYRLDFAYPRLKVCVEYDGHDYHSSDESRATDRKRRKWLRDHGWVVIVVTKDDLRGNARESWLYELRTALADRMR